MYYNIRISMHSKRNVRQNSIKVKEIELKLTYKFLHCLGKRHYGDILAVGEEM